MLSFEQPPFQLGSVTLYADHADPRTFYYAAAQPRLAKYDNRDLMYNLFLYRNILDHDAFTGTQIPDEMGAGFLTLGVECVHDDRDLEDARQELATLMGVDKDLINLAPIPYKSGQMSLIGLDIADSSAPPPPAAQGTARTPFVMNVMGSAQPSLLGDLRGIFSVSLSEDGAAFMEGVHGSGALPLGVCYDLTFEGLCPAVHCTVSAETSQIRQAFEGGIEGQYKWFKADIGGAIENLHRDGHVQIKLISQQTGEAAEKAKQRALELFKEQIIQDLFNPAPPGIPPEAIAGIRAAQNGQNNAQTEAAAGALSDAANNGSVTLKLKAVHETTTGTLSYTFQEASPIERRDGRSAFLQSLMDEDERAEHMTIVDLGQAGSLFDILKITVSGPSKETYEKLNLSRVIVDIFYGDPSDPIDPETRSLILTPDGTRDQTVAFSRNNRSSLAYRYQVTYEFDDDDGVFADRLRYIIPQRNRTARTLSIVPQEDFRFTDVGLRLGTIDEDVRQIDVDLTAQGDNTDFKPETAFRFVRPFTNGQLSDRWKVRSLSQSLSHFDVASTFTFANGETHRVSREAKLLSLINIDDPYPKLRKLTIIPNVVSDGVSAIDVAIAYEDEDSDYRRTFQLLMQAPFEPQSLSWPILDVNHQTISYRFTVHEGGLTETSPEVVTDDPSITVGAELVRLEDLQIRIIGGTLTDNGLDALVVDLDLPTADGSTELKSLFFADGEELVKTVKLVRDPDEKPRFKYRTQAFKVDGTVAESDWTEKVDVRLLPISLRTL